MKGLEEAVKGLANTVYLLDAPPPYSDLPLPPVEIKLGGRRTTWPEDAWALSLELREFLISKGFTDAWVSMVAPRGTPQDEPALVKQ